MPWEKAALQNKIVSRIKIMYFTFPKWTAQITIAKCAVVWNEQGL